MTRKEQAVLLLFGGAVAIGAVVLYVMNARTPGGVIQVEPAEAISLPAPTTVAPVQAANAPQAAIPPSEPAAVVVSVQGAVTKAGVYTLAEGDRIQDLLAAAGGALDDASLVNINLAARLVDGTTLIVPSWNANDYWSYQAAANPPQYTIQQQSSPVAAGAEAAPVTSGAPVTRAANASGLINLNTATQEQLESLPGIGPAYAQAIIHYREQTPFRTVDDAMQVRGIGEKRLEAIRPLVTVE